jgi:hypothetical protein
MAQELMQELETQVHKLTMKTLSSYFNGLNERRLDGMAKKWCMVLKHAMGKHMDGYGLDANSQSFGSRQTISGDSSNMERHDYGPTSTSLWQRARIEVSFDAYDGTHRECLLWFVKMERQFIRLKIPPHDFWYMRYKQRLDEVGR